MLRPLAAPSSTVCLSTSPSHRTFTNTHPVGCAQLKITGTGSEGACGPTISLPGAYKAEDDNIYIPNVYNGFDASTYTAPGGPVASCGGSGNTTPAPSSGSGASNETTPAVPTAASSAAASSAPAATSAPAEETPITSAPAATSEAATSVAAETPAPSATVTAPATGGALPEEFTLETFIAWLREQS